MSLFGRRSASKSVDTGLSDTDWFAASRSVYESTISNYYGSPETMARGGSERRESNDAGIALHFYCKSIDMLHTAYGFGRMEGRRPSDNDAGIVGGFCDALSVTLRDHPAAPVDEVVREVTHRLRSISTTCDAAGLPSNLYRHGLDTMGRVAPQVRVDDIFWH